MSGYHPITHDSTSWIEKRRKYYDPLINTSHMSANSLSHSQTDNHRMPKSDFNSANYQNAPVDPSSTSSAGPYTLASFLMGAMKNSALWIKKTVSGVSATEDITTMPPTPNPSTPISNTRLNFTSPASPIDPIPIKMNFEMNGVGNDSNTFGHQGHEQQGQVHHHQQDGVFPQKGMPFPYLTQDNQYGSPRKDGYVSMSPRLDRTSGQQPPASPQMESVLRALENTRVSANTNRRAAKRCFTEAEADELKRRIDEMTYHQNGSPVRPTHVDDRHSRRYRSYTHGSRIHPGGYNRQINFSSVATSERSSMSPTPRRQDVYYQMRERRRPRRSYFRKRRRDEYPYEYASDAYVPRRGYSMKRRRLTTKKERIGHEKLDGMLYGDEPAKTTKKRKRRRHDDEEIERYERKQERQVNSDEEENAPKIARRSIDHSSPRHLKRKNDGGEDDDVEMMDSTKKKKKAKQVIHPSPQKKRNEKLSPVPASPQSPGFSFSNHRSPSLMSGSRLSPVFLPKKKDDESDRSSTIGPPAELTRTSTVESGNFGSKSNSMEVEDEVENKTSKPMDGPAAAGFSFGMAKEKKGNEDEKDTVMMTSEIATPGKKKPVSSSFSASTEPSKVSQLSPAPPPPPAKKDKKEGEDDPASTEAPAAKKKDEQVPYYVIVMRKRKKRRREEYEKRMERLWGKYNPSKKGTASKLLKKFSVERLHELYEKACDKYQVKPHEEFNGNDGDFSPVQMEIPLSDVSASKESDEYNPESNDTPLPKFQFSRELPKPKAMSDKKDEETTTVTTTTTTTATTETSFGVKAPPTIADGFSSSPKPTFAFGTGASKFEVTAPPLVPPKKEEKKSDEEGKKKTVTFGMDKEKKAVSSFTGFGANSAKSTFGSIDSSKTTAAATTATAPALPASGGTSFKFGGATNAAASTSKAPQFSFGAAATSSASAFGSKKDDEEKTSTSGPVSSSSFSFGTQSSSGFTLTPSKDNAEKPKGTAFPVTSFGSSEPGKFSFSPKPSSAAATTTTTSATTSFGQSSAGFSFGSSFGEKKEEKKTETTTTTTSPFGSVTTPSPFGSGGNSFKASSAPVSFSIGSGPTSSNGIGSGGGSNNNASPFKFSPTTAFGSSAPGSSTTFGGASFGGTANNSSMNKNGGSATFGSGGFSSGFDSGKTAPQQQPGGSGFGMGSSSFGGSSFNAPQGGFGSGASGFNSGASGAFQFNGGGGGTPQVTAASMFGTGKKRPIIRGKRTTTRK